ncbi:MAG: fibronectin type III domain-containing protein [Bacteroidia bacterium]|nr:fibronectin type III domain-containing protein [Bacteroidia bacterium]
MKKIFTFIFAFSAMFAQAADFTTGNIVVALGEVGLPASPASAVSLLEFNTTTENQTSTVQSINLNATAGSTMLTTCGFGEFQLQNSEDGYWLVAMGYNAAAGSATATYKAANKSMIKIGKSGVPSYTELPLLVTNPTRSIATVDGSAYWMNPYGIYGYFSDQSAVVPATSITTGMMSVTGTVHRHLRIFKNKLYAMNGANVFYSDTELPTTAATATNSFFTLTGAASGGFQFFDMDADVSTGWNGTGFDAIYVADAAAGLKKFYWDATLPTPAWVNKGTYANQPSAPKGYVGMAARMESGMPTFYVCQTSSSVVLANQLVRIVDSSMPGDAIMATSTILATADATHSFRSVGFVPTAITATAPDAPTAVSITPGDGQLSVAFTAPASDGGSPITNYRYSLDGGLTFPRAIAQTTSPLVITGLTNGTAYSVQLKAMNKFFDSPATASISATPSGGPTAPEAPTALTVTEGNAQLSVAFTAPASDGGSAITNYKYSINGGFTYFPCVPAQTTSPIIISGLTNGTTYVAKIRAVNAIGDGSVATITGTPNATVGLHSSNVHVMIFATYGGIQVQSGDEQAYKIVNTLGQTIAKGTITSNSQFIPIPSKGMICVQMNGQVTKVVLTN